jgi:hypothetical protein
VLAGCGDDDAGSGHSRSVINDAETGCEAFIEAWCDRAIHCAVEVGSIASSDLELNLEVCNDVGMASAQCDHAADLGPTFDQCLVQIDQKPCSDWNVPMSELGTVTPPESCRGQVLIRP